MVSGLGAGGWEPGLERRDGLGAAKPGVGWEARLGREGQQRRAPRAHGVKGVKVCGRDKGSQVYEEFGSKG